jgi:hypothetical protein
VLGIIGQVSGVIAGVRGGGVATPTYGSGGNAALALPMGGTLTPRARGGPVVSGRSYLVGERGPEILRMGGGRGHISPNGGSKIQVIPSPYFDVVVDGRVVNTGAPMIAAGMNEARTGAQVDLHRMARRRIP